MIIRPAKNASSFTVVALVLIFVFLFIDYAEAGPSYCVSGYSYNSSTNKCEAEPLCSGGGMYDAGINKCVADPTYTCFSSEYTLNDETLVCEAPSYCECSFASLKVFEDTGYYYCGEENGPPCNCSGYGGMDGEGQRLRIALTAGY